MITHILDMYTKQTVQTITLEQKRLTIRNSATLIQNITSNLRTKLH